MVDPIYSNTGRDWPIRQIKWDRMVRQLLIMRLDDETEKICRAMAGMSVEEIRARLAAPSIRPETTP